MNHKAVNFAKKLVAAHTKEHALKIATECETIAKGPQTAILYGEADFYVNQNGHLELSKNQSGKFDRVRALRIKQNQNFWRDVVVAINKGQV